MFISIVSLFRMREDAKQAERGCQRDRTPFALPPRRRRVIYDGCVLRRFLRDIAANELLVPGDRVGIAVSGGADSVALLRLMLEARERLGVVLSVIHFNHKIRGAHAFADEQFVSDLAKGHGLEFICDSADTRAVAANRHLSLEAAGRRLRYEFFRGLITSGVLDKVATAHSLDDQAETVLLRFLRGAGTRGLAGIFPRVAVTRLAGESQTPKPAGAIIRPLLGFRRGELQEYLRGLRQSWREDASNLDVKFTRNRVRHQLIPLLERDFNPNVAQILSEQADIARAEEEFWASQIGHLVPRESDDRTALDLPPLSGHGVAVQRRVLRAAADRLGLALDFHHVEAIRGLLSEPHAEPARIVELPGGWTAVRVGNSLRIASPASRNPLGEDYELLLPVPGEVLIPKLALALRTIVIRPGAEDRAYNDDQRLDLSLLGQKLTVRNWRAGDRFCPAHSKAPRKLKELLQERRVAQPAKASWPVVVSRGEIVWVRGFPVASQFIARPGTSAVVIEEYPASQLTTPTT